MDKEYTLREKIFGKVAVVHDREGCDSYHYVVNPNRVNAVVRPLADVTMVAVGVVSLVFFAVCPVSSKTAKEKLQHHR